MISDRERLKGISKYLSRYYPSRKEISVIVSDRYHGKLQLSITTAILTVEKGELDLKAKEILTELEQIPRRELQKIEVLGIPRYLTRENYLNKLLVMMPNIDVIRIDIGIFDSNDGGSLPDIRVREIDLWYTVDQDVLKTRFDFDYDNYWL